MKLLSAFAITLLLSVTFVQAKPVSVKQMEEACKRTKGTWRELPAWCDHMHPRTWKKLSLKHRQYCQMIFNNPCDCGTGKRFSVYKVVGCVRSSR